MKITDATRQKINYWLLGIIAFLLTIAVVAAIVFIRSNHPLQQAKKETIKLAKEYAGLKTVGQFYWFSREKVYFTVTGENDEGQKIAVIVPKSGEKLRVVQQKDGITSQQAETAFKKENPKAHITKSSLGIYEKQVVWEITAKAENGEINYVLFSFEDGKEIQSIQTS